MVEHLGDELADALGCESGEFREQVEKILLFLQKKLGFGLWMFARVQGEDWIVLNVQDASYGVTRGDVFCWEESFCSQMVEGKGPQIAPDSNDVPCYRDAEIGKKVPIRSYVGVPIRRSSGQLFGTLCAIDPRPKDPSIVNQLDLVNMFGGVLAQLVEEETRIQAADRTAQELELAAEIDSVTGLKNRLAWEKMIDDEEFRADVLGSITLIAVVSLDMVNSSIGDGVFRTNDEIYTEFARILQNCLKGMGSGFRVDGNDFAILLPDIIPSAARKILLELRAGMFNCNIRASIGYSLRDPKKGLRFAWSQAQSEAKGTVAKTSQQIAS